jgi:(p)ppGpp synthase/HD superfamily hydrolase
MPNVTLDDAIALAVKAHSGIKDRGGQPYILHPLRLMMRMETEAERMVAVLHDVVEDTSITFDELRAQGFSSDVIAALDCLTRRKAVNETYEQFIERIAPNPLARKVKLADLEDNMNVLRLPSLGDEDGKRLAKYRASWARLKALG